MIKIYRYENQYNGNGPFLKLSGYNKTDGKIYDNGYIYGCLSKDDLIALMKEYNNYPKENYIINVYYIPKEEVKIKKREVLFPKKYSKFL